MDSTALNPYKAPESERDDEKRVSFFHGRRLVASAWICSVVVVGYGLFGAVANGIDLVRTRSSRDLITEGRLLILFGLGLFLCWLTYFVQKHKRNSLALPLLIFALAGAGYVLYDLL